MKRFTIIFAAALFMTLGAATLAQTARVQSAPAGRAPYDPFAMKRAAAAPAGSQENNAFNRRQEIVKRLKDHTRPPNHPGNRSPHVPGEPFHDRNGDGIEDHGGHGPNNNPGGPFHDKDGDGVEDHGGHGPNN